MYFSDEILRQLGPEYERLADGPEYEVGSWFWILGPDIKVSSGRPFSEKRSKRPVILARLRPSRAVLYPRSASRRGGFDHQAHRHQPPEPTCRVSKNGWVKLRVPVTVKRTLLNETSFSCTEPEGTGLLKAIREAIEPRLS